MNEPFKTYDEVVDYLYNTLLVYQKTGNEALKLDLSRITRLCSALGDPQNDFASIHIAGSNGKGSVSHMVAAIMQSSGKKIGLYTSPHITDFIERIKINGQPMEQVDVVAFVNQNHDLIEEQKPTFFELTVAMAFSEFRAQQVDIAIIETGLGGRLDSTNIITPLLSVITNISLEHTDILGDNITDIAIEKAGIIKPNTPVIIGETEPESQEVFESTAEKLNVPISFADQYWKEEKSKISTSGSEYWLLNKHNKRIEYYQLDSIATYQKFNSKTSLEVIYQYNLLDGISPVRQDQIEYGLAHFTSLTNFVGRMQVISESPLTIIDVAHNPSGIEQSITQVESFKKKNHFVMAFSKNKDIDEILRLLPDNGSYYFCKFDLERTWNPKEYEQKIKLLLPDASYYNDANSALVAAQKRARPEDCIAVMGSVFLVSDIVKDKYGT